MVDFNEWEFRVGLGHSAPHVRCKRDPRELFPDGMKMVLHRVTEYPGVVVDLLNRQSGRSWKNNGPNPELWSSGGGINSLSALVEPLEPFGAVKPVKIEGIRGGLRLFLPETLPPIMKRGRYKEEAGESEPAQPEKAKPSSYTVEAKTDQIVVPPKVPERDSSRAKPIVSLEDAVAAVNHWKTLMEDRLRLEVNSTGGKLRAFAEYGEA